MRERRTHIVAWLLALLVGTWIAAGIGSAMPFDIPDWSAQQGDFRQLLHTDTNTPPAAPTPTFTTAAGGTATGRITLPAGTVQLRIWANASGLLFSYAMLVTGHQSGNQYFGDPAVPGSRQSVASPTLGLTIPVERDDDTQVDFSILGDPARSVSYFVSNLTTPEAPGQSGQSQSVILPNTSVFRQAPYDWQTSGTFDGPIAAPSITQGGLTGFKLQLAAYRCSVVSSAGVYVGTLTFTDATPQTVWRDVNGVQAVNGYADRASESGLAVVAASGLGLVMALNNALPANVFARLSMAGYYQSG